MKKKFIMPVVLCLLTLASGRATAGTATSSFTTQTNVIANCKITTAASIVDFGNYDTTAAADNDNGTGVFGFKCTKGTAYKVYITGTRRMTSAPETLNFELYSDAGRTSVFPSTDAAGISGSSASNGTEVVTNIYGRIPAGQDVTAGKTFTTTLIATVEY